VDQLRAGAALYVAVYHALLVYWPNGGPRPPWYLRWADFGHVGVAVFIVVSGYSLALGPALRGRTSAGRYSTFMLKRARRLLPPYWVALAGSILLLALAPHSVRSGGSSVAGAWGKGPVPFRSGVAFTFLMHDVFRVPSPNSAMWSIAVEWHLYFLFPLLVFIGYRFGMGKLVAASVVVGVALHFALVHTGAVGTTPHFLALFCFGIASAYAVAWHRREARPARPGGARLAWTAIGLGVVGFAALAHWEVGADLVCGALVATGLYLLGVNAEVPVHGPTAVGRWLAKIGFFSYSLYLVHLPAEKIIWRFGVDGLGLSPVPAFLLLAVTGIAAALSAAWVLFVLVERPAMRWSRNTPVGPQKPIEPAAAGVTTSP
jgi:peptidoglycan/LPS O-acetylase OafA/YrhL